MILQRWFKGILFRRRTKPIFVERGKGFVLGPSILGRSITLETTIHHHFMIIQRVARRIQRCFRRWSLRMRLNCLINIAEYASQIDSNEVYLEQTMYRNLELIFKTATGAPWHKPKDEQTVVIRKIAGRERQTLSKTRVHVYSDTPQALFERRFRFEVSAKTHKICLSFSSQVDRSGRYSVSNLPAWFQRKTNSEIPKITFRKKSSTFLNNIMALIHMQPHPVNDGAPTVINISSLRDARLENDMMNTKLVKICLPSVEEARNRAVVMALLTCNMRMSSNSFVRLYTKRDFTVQRRVGRTYRQIRQIWRENKLWDDDIRTFLAPSSIFLKQLHNGLIRKREEPYMTLLRARPKEKKTHFERFIVLGDADPRDVEERLGSALVYNQVIEKLQTTQNPLLADEDMRDDPNFIRQKYLYRGQ